MRRVLLLILCCVLMPWQALAAYPPEIPWGDLAVADAALPSGKTMPVYTGPGKDYLRAAEGNAAVSTADWAQVFVSEGGWTLVHYEVEERCYRFGWVEGAFGLEATFHRAKATLCRPAELTDDPLGQRAPVASLAADTPVTWLGMLGDAWVYVETAVEGAPVRGFVLRDRVTLEEPEKVYADCLYPIRKYGLWGYMDYQGQVRIKPRFRRASAFCGAGYAQVSSFKRGRNPDNFDPDDYEEGIIDKQGQWVVGPFDDAYLDCGYDGLYYGGEDTGVTWVIDGESDTMGFFNLPNGYYSGMLFGSATYPWVSSSDPLVYAQKGEYSGFVNRYTGETVIDFQYQPDDMSSVTFQEGFCVLPAAYNEATQSFEECIVIDKQNRPLKLPEGYSAVEMAHFSEGLMRVYQRETGLYGFMDTTGELVIQARFPYADDFSEGLCGVCDPETGLWGYIDHNGFWALAPVWLGADPFAKGIAVVRTEEGFAVINRDNKVLSERLNGWYAPMSDYGVALLSMKGSCTMIDAAGNTLLDASAGYRSPDLDDDSFAEGLQAVVGPDGLMGYLDTRGQLAIPCQWDKAVRFRNGLAGVEKDGKLAYINHCGEVVWQEP